MTIQFFDNTDDMFTAIRRGVEAAKARATPRQNAITYGDYWLRVVDDFVICGRITPQEELWATEAELGASAEEIESEKEMQEASYADGFRFGRAYSIVCPEGELGDTHVSDMVPITEEEFNQSKGLNWIPEKIVELPWFTLALFSRI